MESQTAKLENINKFSRYGLRRRPTYEEVTNLLDENKKLGLPLPNRDATFFRNSPEGSFFDGIHQMEDLKDEQQRLLLRQMNDILMRQNIRTAGRTLHADRARLNAIRPPRIVEANMQVDADGNTQPAVQPTTPSASSSIQQLSQLDLELQKRDIRAQKRREEIAMNEAEKVRRFTRPTLQEQQLGIQPHLIPVGTTTDEDMPQQRPQIFNIATTTDDDMPQRAVAKPKAKPIAKRRNEPASSSTKPPIPVVQMDARNEPRVLRDVSSSSKRATPETELEPRGRRGRPKMKLRQSDARTDAEKREGDEPEAQREPKRRNKKREMALRGAETEADDEDETKTVNNRKIIKEPLKFNKIGIQKLKEEFDNAINKDLIAKKDADDYNKFYKDYRKAVKEKNEKEKSRNLLQMRSLYKDVLYKKLVDMFENQ